MNLGEKNFRTHGEQSRAIDPRRGAPKKSEEGKQHEIVKLLVKANRKNLTLEFKAHTATTIKEVDR